MEKKPLMTLDPRTLFDEVYEEYDVLPKDLEETWGAFKSWYVVGLERLWRRKMWHFFKQREGLPPLTRRGGT